jgi:hypothetical protein
MILRLAPLAQDFACRLPLRSRLQNRLNFATRLRRQIKLSQARAPFGKLRAGSALHHELNAQPRAAVPHKFRWVKHTAEGGYATQVLISRPLKNSSLGNTFTKSVFLYQKRTARFLSRAAGEGAGLQEALLLLLGSAFLGGFLCSGFTAGFCALSGLLFRGSSGAGADSAGIDQVQGVFSVERVLAH